MADNAPAAPAQAQSDGSGLSNGDRRGKSSHTASGSQKRSRDEGGRGQGRGGGSGGWSRGGGRGFGSKTPPGRHKKGDMGRVEWNRNKLDRRQRNDDENAKRRKIEDGGVDVASPAPFTKEEIESEARKPKRKVAVMIGYAGTGYKGMQINSQEKTIEGDIFKAFVAAGAISKANADDPKKSSLVRCARTDKGVHAAGNVISLKLIVEEPDIIQKINENLPPQIRVWGIERTNGSFSCYQTCDSRWYEYLIPTYSFLPPRPQSFLGKKLVEAAEKEGTIESYQARQEDVASFWHNADERFSRPILDKLDPEMRLAVRAIIDSSEEENRASENRQPPQVKQEVELDPAVIVESQKGAGAPEDVSVKLVRLDNVEAHQDFQEKQEATIDPPPLMKVTSDEELIAIQLKGEEPHEELNKSILTTLEQAVKDVKAAYIAAKKAYRISDSRRKMIEEALECYTGTQNFHNYTIQKSFSDPSAKRVIRSFKVGSTPIIINNTEWLSLKVHGQSFMMHQIRKMVAMVALVVRCGSSNDIIKASYGPANISIPKAPGLGLLLEKPVFDNYNERAVKEYSRGKIDFDKYQKEIDDFKQREIYDRIFREEEKDHQFHTFFHHIDHYRTDFFLWVTASGISAATQSKAPARTDDNSDDEADFNGEEG